MIFTILLLILSTFVQSSYVPHDGKHDGGHGGNYDGSKGGKCPYKDQQGYSYSYDGKFYLAVKEYSNDKYYDIVYQLNDGQIEYGNYEKYPIKRDNSSDCVDSTVTTTEYETSTYTTVVGEVTAAEEESVATDEFSFVESSATDDASFVIEEEPLETEEPSDVFSEEPSEEPTSEESSVEPTPSFEELPTSSEGVYKRDGSLGYHKTPPKYWFTLDCGVIKDSKGRIGEIVANHQFQFDYPVQPDALYTKGFAVVTYKGVKYLALNGKTRFWNSAVNDQGVYKIYDKPITDQSKPINIVVLDASKK
ncbi:putative cell wall mannoprotein PIR32 [Candida viswanathii]|uniref:Putative cell wall mannoprotein PIR32 n=1 Tax=Candida viswanathii TaxID=5486 RepID=A0A367Y3T2_9ASCO|nr:putative cell wall mannoprotein PIR32 [Candida viswanathii]